MNILDRIDEERRDFVRHTGIAPDTVYLGREEYYSIRQVSNAVTVCHKGVPNEYVMMMRIVKVQRASYIGVGVREWA